MAIEAQFTTSLSQVDSETWNGICGTDYPFLRHEFLYGLERTGCTNAETGWQPCHLLLREENEIMAVMPLYLKSHSWGEYVFDWSWADAWRSRGLSYYPKLVSAIPFTPATGPRLCCTPAWNEFEAWPAALSAITQWAQEKEISSWHLLFPEEAASSKLKKLGAHQRLATQFHWFNDGYEGFDDFLSTFSSRKRKTLKRERRRVQEQGLELKTLVGTDIGERDWHQFHHFYQLTYAKRSGHGGYLSREFFTETAASMGDQVIMVLAYLGTRAVAGSLFFRSGDTLYGRYWGCEREMDCLHFEACYYRGIDFCIAHGISRFDPGAQGEHKIQRGFRPVITYSNHWIADPELSVAVADFTHREAAHNRAYLEGASSLLPFRKEIPGPD